MKKVRWTRWFNALANWQDSFDDDIFPQEEVLCHIFDNFWILP
jgi:hypothetical protein